MKKMLKTAAVLAAMAFVLAVFGACSDGSSGDSGPSERARYESSDGDVLTFYDNDTFVLAGSSKAAAVARAIGKTITGKYTGDLVSGTGLKLTADDGTEIPVSGSGSTLTITVDGTAYQFTKKSGGSGGGSGGGGSTNTSENPFGFTEEYRYCYLDKDGKVLQKVEYKSEGDDVEGAVFLVHWPGYDGTGKVELKEYYGDYEDVTIPNGVTEISLSAFWGCTSVKKVTIPSSVTTIGGFYDCTSLESVTIPDSVTYIGSFQGCTSLASVTIPDSVTEIYRYMFYDCTSLASVTFTEQSGWYADYWSSAGMGTYNGYGIEDMSDPSNNAKYLKYTSPVQPNDATRGKKDWGVRDLYRETE